MKIVIAGAGDVGSHLAKMLSNEKHRITLLDTDEERLKFLASTLDLVTYQGTATSINTLSNIGISSTDLFISVTNSEAINITSAILAKKLGAKKCLARIDTLENISEENLEHFKELGIDYMFYPELLAATEIVNLMRQSATSDVMHFAGGKLFLYVMRMEKNAPSLDMTLEEFHNLSQVPQYKVVAIIRNKETILPQSTEKILEGDQAFIITTEKGINLLMKNFGKKAMNIKNVMILGGSRIGRNAAKQLSRTYNVKMIEQDRTKSYVLSNEMHGTVVINGDGRNIDLMNEEGLAQMDAFIAVTGDTETNMLTCLLAKRLGVQKTIAEVENIDYIRLAENMGIDVVINKKIIAASHIFGFTMTDEVSSVKLLTGSSAEIMEYVAKPDSKVTKGTLEEVGFPSDAIIGGIVRGKDTLIPDEATTVKPFDKVVVFAMPSAFNKLGKFFNSSDRFF
jgi:trk system potassium uptake protein TrkA